MSKHRAWLAGLLALLWAGIACAAAPVVPVPQASTALTPLMQTVLLLPAASLDPDGLWDSVQGTPVPPAQDWELRGGERWLGRVTLAAGAAEAAYMLAVPMPQVDEVRMWWRVRGGTWHAAAAGDRVPLSQWPFANAFPAFPFAVGAQPVDVMVMATNAARLHVPMTLLPDSEFRGNIVKRASLSGVMMGLGAMVLIVCLLGAVAYGGRARWLLAAVAAWALSTITANNGYLAVWLTGEWPEFNDWARIGTALPLAGLVVLLFTEVLDPLHVRPMERALGIAAAVAAPAYAIAQIFWLPAPWRVLGAVSVAVLAIACCVALCVLNAMRGGRHVQWPALAIAALIAVPALSFARPEQIGGVDVRAATVAGSLYVALLLLRETLMLRDRHGRDVLGRAATTASRDPLTALWSYEGFAQRHAEAALREAAGQGTSAVMLLLLPGLEHANVQHGTTLTERTLVLFAAELQRLLGPQWAVARLSQTRFGAISLRPFTANELADTATQVMSRCGRITQPLNLVAEFDLRLATSQCRLAEVPLPELVRQLRYVAMALSPGKRIVHMGSVPALPLGDAVISKP